MSTSEVLAALDGRITYRQLDHWIRTGRITLADHARGSGSHRTYTPVEVAALRDFVERSISVELQAIALADGSVWRALIAKHRPRLVREVPT